MTVGSKLVRVRVNFRVNNLDLADALIRHCPSDPGNFEVVIEHPFLGPFALHGEFVLELRASDGLATWRKVPLEELKLVLLEASQNVGANQMEEERRRARRISRGLGVSSFEYPPRLPIEGDWSHIDRAREALSRGGVRYRIVGGIGSHARIWGHATFQVPSLLGARIRLLGAGFLQVLSSKHVLVDSTNGWSIRLIEESR